MGTLIKAVRGWRLAWLWPLLLVACQVDAPEAAQRGQGAAPLAASAPLPAAGAQTVTLEAMVEAARNDAARRTGQSAAAVQVDSAQHVDWPDGGLGCPQPGMSYTMALVPGYRISIRVQDRALEYHASERGTLLLCPSSASRAPAVNSRI